MKACILAFQEVAPDTPPSAALSARVSRWTGMTVWREPLDVINVAAMVMGLELLPSGPQKQRATAMLRRLRRKPHLRITVETAATFGRLSARIRQAGRDSHVRANDLWLAAQAIERNYAALTANGRDFRDIPGLRMTVVPLP